MNTFLLSLLLVGCGISKPSYKKYDSEAGTSGETRDKTDPSEKDKANLAAFEKEMASIKTGCAISGCHLTTAISGTKLSATDQSINRTAILAYTGTTSTKLDSKLRGTSHGGGKVTNPTKAQIDAWLTVENTK
jgi:hypothetical protein